MPWPLYGNVELSGYAVFHLDELLRYSDRILVFFAGKMSPPLEAATTTVQELGQLIGGTGLGDHGEKSEGGNARTDSTVNGNGGGDA